MYTQDLDIILTCALKYHKRNVVLKAHEHSLRELMLCRLVLNDETRLLKSTTAAGLQTVPYFGYPSRFLRVIITVCPNIVLYNVHADVPL